MLIGIDGNEANIEDRVGVNQYAYEILWGLYRLQDKWENGHQFIVYLKNLPLKDLPKANKYFKYEVLGDAPFWIITKLTTYLYLSKKKPDILFSPSHYTMPVSNVPRICSIMDLGYLDFSGQFKRSTFWQLKYWTAISVFVSKHIIAISNATKKDIVRHYPNTSKKISVTLLGYDKSEYNTDVEEKDVRRIKNRYSIVDDYVLFLSTLKPSKNIEGLVEAFSIFKKKNKDISNVQLVIAGKKGWMYEQIFEKVKTLGIEGSVIFTGFIDEEDKKALLYGAKLFASPSYWEGFGLHVLESIACGTPVLVSDAGSLPEVVGDAGVIVNPHRPESISKGLEKVLKMPKKSYNMLVEKGLRRADTFSWEKTAKETLKILEKTGK